MFVLTMAFAVVGNDHNAKWRMLGIQSALTDVSADKKGCIFAAWEKQAGSSERVTGCDQYEPFRGDATGTAVLAASKQFDVDW